jgi:hypothetical protein
MTPIGTLETRRSASGASFVRAATGHRFLSPVGDAVVLATGGQLRAAVEARISALWLRPERTSITGARSLKHSQYSLFGFRMMKRAPTERASFAAASTDHLISPARYKIRRCRYFRTHRHDAPSLSRSIVTRASSRAKREFPVRTRRRYTCGRAICTEIRSAARHLVSPCIGRAKMTSNPDPSLHQASMRRSIGELAAGVETFSHRRYRLLWQIFRREARLAELDPRLTGHALE